MRERNFKYRLLFATFLFVAEFAIGQETAMSGLSRSEPETDHVLPTLASTGRDSAQEQGNNMIALNVVTAVKREFELHYERLFFERKLGLKPHASWFAGDHYSIRGKRTRNYSGGLDVHYYYTSIGITRFFAGGGFEAGNYTNEQIEIGPPAHTGFDPAQRTEQYTYFYGRLGALIEPAEFLNIALTMNFGSRQNRRLTNRDTFWHFAPGLFAAFRF